MEDRDFRLLVHTAPSLLLILRPDLTIADASDAYLSATATRREEIVGRDVFDVFPENPEEVGATGVGNLRASLERVLRDHATDVMSVQKYDIRGPLDAPFQERHWSIVNTPVFDPATGALVYIVNRVEDVTAYVRMLQGGNGEEKGRLRVRTGLLEVEAFQRAREIDEANGRLRAANADLGRTRNALREANDTLERRIREATAELAAANEEIRAFSYAVAHDLRSPLRAIEGFCHALAAELGDTLPPRAALFLERIQAGAARMGRLIDDLLRLSRITRAEMARHAVDLSKLAHEIVGELRRRDPERQVDVRIDEEMTVLGDSDLLRIALQNLFDNAWKFTARSPAARVEFTTVPLEGGAPAFVVRDTGVGFEQAYAHTLFAPFQRLHARDEFEGTGIGLATVMRIVTRHGGKVWAEGKVDEGAAIYFTLPTGRTPTPRAAPRPPPPRRPSR